MKERKGLKFVTKMANRKASQRRKDGEVPKHMSLDGHLALMLDKIQRYFKKRDIDEVLGLAADGLFALEAAFDTLTSKDIISDEEFDNFEVPDSPAKASRKKADGGFDINDLLPDELQTWQHDPNVARELREYLEATQAWEKLDPIIKDQIVDAEDATEEIEEEEEEVEEDG
jgi:hypothetical protein